MSGGDDCTQATKMVLENCQCYGKKQIDNNFRIILRFWETAQAYPSPRPKFCPKWEVSVNVGLREGVGG